MIYTRSKSAGRLQPNLLLWMAGGSLSERNLRCRGFKYLRRTPSSVKTIGRYTKARAHNAPRCQITSRQMGAHAAATWRGCGGRDVYGANVRKGRDQSGTSRATFGLCESPGMPKLKGRWWLENQFGLPSINAAEMDRIAADSPSLGIGLGSGLWRFAPFFHALLIKRPSCPSHSLIYESWL